MARKILIVSDRAYKSSGYLAYAREKGIIPEGSEAETTSYSGLHETLLKCADSGSFYTDIIAVRGMEGDAQYAVEFLKKVRGERPDAMAEPPRVHSVGEAHLTKRIEKPKGRA